MTTVLYLLRDNDVEGAEDLRLSLRSLDHAFPDDDVRVVVSTAVAPPWFTGVHVEAHDVPGLGKHWSMTEKVRATIRTLGLDEPFLLSSDDHIAPLEPPCRLADWPHLARTTPLDRFLGQTGGNVKWRESVGWARDVIARRYMKPTTRLVLCTHRNVWIDPACLPVVDELFPVPAAVPGTGAEWRGPSPDDTFGAIAVAGGLVREEDCLPVQDVKSADPFKFFMGSYLTTKPSGRYGCSIPPGADAVRGPLWRIFRRPSRWERRG